MAEIAACGLSGCRGEPRREALRNRVPTRPVPVNRMEIP